MVINKNNIKYFFTLLFLFFVKNIICQEKYPQDYFSSPMDIPLILSGSFGELRPNHFHAGIDIKTEGKTGKNIYSIADGHVSRIKVSPWGYGKTIYIDHPNGFTSVYAHLRNFNDTTDNYVKNEQYKAKKYSIELFPDPADFVIKKGELIGISGNTGRSGGPHLHFEIRKTESEFPLNTMLFNFKITDNIKPKIFNLYIYPQDRNSKVNHKNEKIKIPVYGNNGEYSLPAHSSIRLSGNIGLGIEVTDYQNFTNNKFGIYSIELKIDSARIYYMELNEFSYDETRYINSHIDYEEYVRTGKKIHKTFIDPNNKLSIYKNVVDRGIFNFNDDSIYQITLTVNDVSSNTSILMFKTERDSLHQDILFSCKTDSLKNIIMPYQVAHYFDEKDITIIIPKDALYDTLNFNYSRSDLKNGQYSAIHHVHNKYTPVHKEYTLSIKADRIPERLKDKALIASLGKKRLISIGGEVKDNYLTVKAREFGSFVITVDTIPPKIKPVNIKEKANLGNIKKIDIRISDDLSGIASYSGFIDNKWVLFEYEPKKNLISYIFDDKVEKTGEQHDFKLVVTDVKGNRSEYSTTFYY